MGSVLLEQIKETLITHKRINFNLQYHHKGHLIEIEFSQFKNHECGEIYDLLEEWLGYGDLNEFLLAHDCFYNFSGWFEYEIEEIVIYIVFTGPYDEEFETISVEFDHDFIINELGLGSLVDSIPNFNTDYFFVVFDLEKEGVIELRDINYYDNEYIKINLGLEQLEVLKKYLTEFVTSKIPSLNIEFPCNQIWFAECYDNQLSIQIKSSPVKIKWDEIYSE
jgi:hypothetical protein